jgi:eukaryotic-like serine/threonine-protein kinase
MPGDGSQLDPGKRWRIRTMTDDPRVQQLLDELLDSHATPELVCGSCPELLPVVRNRWRRMCRIRADLDALFPPSGEPPPQPPDGTAAAGVRTRPG